MQPATRHGYRRRQTARDANGYPTFTTLTGNATPHDKGAYTQLYAATDFDIGMIVLMVAGMRVINTATAGAIDIAIGDAASEKVIVEGLLAGTSLVNSADLTGPTTDRSFFIPLYIPAGVAVSARLQSLITVDTCTVWLEMLSIESVEGLGFPVFSKCTTYGFAPTTSLGVNLGTSYTELTASCTNPADAFFISVQGKDSGGATALGSIQIGVGAATEAPLGAPIWACSSSNEYIQHEHQFPLIATDVPTGTRIAGKATNFGENSTVIHCLTR